LDGIGQLFSRFYNSIWFKLIMAAVILLIAYYVGKAVYKRICRGLINTVTYTREFSADGAYEGEVVTLTETVHNRNFFPIFVVDVWGYIFNDLRITDAEFDPKKGMQPFAGRFTMLMPYMQLKRVHNVKLNKRGYYKLEGVEMLISDSHRYIESKAEIYVYPSPARVETSPVTMSMIQGESRSYTRLLSDPFNVSGVRDYVFGDPFNSINFKATAKSGGFAGRGIKVNNCDFVSDRTLMVYVNFRTDPDAPMPTKIYNKIVEDFLSSAAWIMREAEEMGYRAGFAANCVNADNSNKLRFPIYGGEIHFRDIMRGLSLVRPAAGVSFPGLIEEDISRGMQNTEVYVFSVYPDPAAEDRIRVLRQMGNTVKTFIFTGK